MTVYNGIIGENFLRAEIEFIVVLPEFCENQEFKLYEETSSGDLYWDNFDLILNDREAITKASDGVAIYTGKITPINIETIVIAQVIIERSEVENFRKRKFMLEVV